MSEQWTAPEGDAVEVPKVVENAMVVEYESAGSSALMWVRWAAAVVVAGVWVWVVVKLNHANEVVVELTDDFFDSASAPQVTQVASQALVQQLMYLGIGLAVSAVGCVVALAARRD